jgi:hypothetical protein
MFCFLLPVMWSLSFSILEGMSIFFLRISNCEVSRSFFGFFFWTTFPMLALFFSKVLCFSWSVFLASISRFVSRTPWFISFICFTDLSSLLLSLKKFAERVLLFGLDLLLGLRSFKYWFWYLEDTIFSSWSSMISTCSGFWSGWAATMLFRGILRTYELV